jgi:hypothetical protein
MLNAKRGFRRLNGCRQMATFVAALAVTSELFHRHGMLQESYERASRRSHRQWSRLGAGRSDDLGPES